MDLSAPEEIHLVRQALDDLNYFLPLYESYCNKIYSYCFYKLPSKQDAEDITSEVFTRALTAFANGNYQPAEHSGFSAWLYRIAHNLIVDFYRANSNFKRIELTDVVAQTASHAEEIDYKVDTDDLCSSVRGILKRFDDQTQSIFVLKFNQDLSFQEIAEILGVNLSTVKMKYYRALELIKKLLNIQK